MKAATGYLTSLAYEVPEQNLTISLKEMPAKPGDGFIIRNVRLNEPD